MLNIHIHSALTIPSSKSITFIALDKGDCRRRKGHREKFGDECHPHSGRGPWSHKWMSGGPKYFVRSPFHFQQFSSFIFNLIKILELHETQCVVSYILSLCKKDKLLTCLCVKQTKKTKLVLKFQNSINWPYLWPPAPCKLSAPPMDSVDLLCW